jgi:Recombination endonuclease VII
MPHKDPAQRREYQQSRKPERNARQRERRVTDPAWAEADRIKKREAYARRRVRRETDPEFDEMERMRSREASRRRRVANPEAARAEVREWARRRRAADPQAHRDRVRQWRLDNPQRHRANRLRLAHGPEIADDFVKMWDEQHGCCYLCGNPLPESGRGVNIDHDHSCCPSGKSCRRCRRGLACTRCNTLIGLVGDDPELLVQIAASLEIVALRIQAARKAAS